MNACGPFRYCLKNRSEGGRKSARIDNLKELGVHKMAPSHCSGDHAIAKFRAAFEKGFIEMGVGRVIEIGTDLHEE